MAHSSETQSAFDALAEKVRNTEELTRHERDRLLIRLDERTTRLAKHLEGNGQAGMVKEFQMVKTRQENCPARNRKWGGIITAVAAWIAALTAIAAVVYTH